MLSLTEFSGGYLKDVKEQSLLLPRDKFGSTILLAPSSGSLTAFFLDGPHQFNSFEASKNKSWAGLIVPAVEVQVDEKSIFNADSQDVPLGALVRMGPNATIFSRVDDGGFHLTRRVLLASNLPASSEDISIGFYRWSITAGKGSERRTLATVDVTKKASPN